MMENLSKGKSVIVIENAVLFLADSQPKVIQRNHGKGVVFYHKELAGKDRSCLALCHRKNGGGNV